MSQSNADPKTARVAMDEELVRITEEFGVKLGSSVKSFIRNTKTCKDELRAMLRCLLKCINSLHNVWKSFSRGQRFVEAKDRPVVHVSDYSSKDGLRSDGRAILRFFKNQTLDCFLTAFDPHVRSARISEGKAALLIIENALKECDFLIDRVINEGYDCASTDSENNVGDENEDTDDESDDDESQG